MTVTRRLLLAAALWPFAAFAQPAPAPAAKDTVIVIPHTHWEGAVFKTREEYLDIGLPHILKAVNLMKRYPGYRFVLDQMAYVKPFMERYPSEASEFRKLVAEGRLALVGGIDTMHDNNMPSGESIARQYLLGKLYFRTLGGEARTGWGLDTFGHNAQMPQILKLAGMESYWFQRGVPGPGTPSEFLWEGIDGSRIPAFWLPISYGALAGIPEGLLDFADMVSARLGALAPFTRGPGKVLMAGADVWEPEERVPIMVDRLNRGGSAPFTLRIGVPSDYETLVAKRGERPTVRGELNPVFQGIYSSRIEMKQWNRDLERLLGNAEKTAVMAGHTGDSTRQRIEDAWEPMLFNQAHDVASGVMVDKVFEDSIHAFRVSKRLTGEIASRNYDALLARIETRGEGVPVAVFNLLAWPRTDYAEAEAAFTGANVREVALLDPAGQPVPFQMVRAERNGDGGIRLATLGFVAREVPAMGYALYRVVPRRAGMDPPPAPAFSGSADTRYVDHGSIENEFYRASFHLWNGEMSSLVLKENGWEALAAPGNVVAREDDGGDFWELYGTLNGARFTLMTKPVPGPRARATVFSNEFVGGSGSTRHGPVVSEFRISHPFGKNQFSTSVRLYAGVRRVDIHTEVVNQEQLVRYRAMFPSAVRSGVNTHEIPFGAIERKQSQEYPAQNWIDLSGEDRGLALLNRGLPGNNVADNTLLLSLARSARLISYGYIGGYEPGVSSDGGLELGKRLAFDYALIPHTGDWRKAGIYRAGLEFNNPLVVRATDHHAGNLPARWGLFEISTPQVVVSAVKPSREGRVAVRVYEPEGKHAAAVRLRFAVPVTRVREANLIEDPGRDVSLRDGAFSFDLRPFEIKTFVLNVGQTSPASLQARQGGSR